MSSLIEQLPNEVIGNIVAQLTEVTGSVGILNEADIPVTVRYMQNLAYTSKRMYSCVNDPYVFFYSLAKKYPHPPEYFAAKLNTISARVYLWDYIKANKYDEAYNVIQNIYLLASNILKEGKEAGLDFDFPETNEKWSSPNPFYYQTHSGFFLYLNSEPTHIATPFGEIKIFCGGAYGGYSSYSITEIFIKRLKATFERMAGAKDGRCREIVRSNSDKIRKIEREELREVGEEELESKKGTNKLIVCSSNIRRCVYRIRQVCGIILPEPIFDKNTLRSSRLINIMWEMLERNRLGKNPITKEDIVKTVKTEKNKTTVLKNLHEVTSWAIDLIKKLSNQPIFKGLTLTGTPSKVLYLDCCRDAITLELLNNASKLLLEKDTHWHISEFVFGKHDISIGIQLCLYESVRPCNLNVLKKAYEEVLNSVGQGWEMSRLRDYPEIEMTESEEEYVLFIKKQSPVQEEAALIGNLADLLGISMFVNCYDHQKDEINYPYLWIRKDKLEEVKETLQLKPFQSCK